MECSLGVAHSKTLFVVIEKQILQDIAEGVLLELIELADACTSKKNRTCLSIIAKYMDNLARISE